MTDIYWYTRTAITLLIGAVIGGVAVNVYDVYMYAKGRRPYD